MSEFSELMATADADILEVCGEDVVYQIQNGPEYSLRVVLDRSEQTRTNLRVWATAWALLSGFELGEPRPGEFLYVGDQKLAVAKVFPDEFGGRVLHLVLA
jgi:hypothetical protein